jgi:transcriptional regulator with XRE-family HTH domain
MGSELFDLMGIDANDPKVRVELEDARQAERLIDTLVELRQRLGLTQAGLAQRMSTTQSAVSKFERAGGDPRLSTLQRYARAVEARLRCVVDASAVSADWRTGRTAAVQIESTTLETGYEEPYMLPVRVSA